MFYIALWACSPCKSFDELLFILREGVTLNINSWRELQVVADVLAKIEYVEGTAWETDDEET